MTAVILVGLYTLPFARFLIIWLEPRPSKSDLNDCDPYGRKGMSLIKSKALGLFKPGGARVKLRGFYDHMYSLGGANCPKLK